MTMIVLNKPLQVRFMRRLFLFFVMSAVMVCASVTRAQSADATASGITLVDGKRVMVLGDSITQAGTYVSFIEYLLQKEFPQAAIDIVSVGLSSETASGLSEKGHAGGKFPRPCIHERLERALTAVKPQVVMACYGMNDGIYLPYDEKRMQAFRDGMTKLVDQCTAAGAQVILITPPAYDNYRSQSDYDQVLGKFAEWEKQTPPKGVIAVADLHTVMVSELQARQKNDPQYHFSKDGIHPAELGHLVMALAILKELKIYTAPGTAEDLLAKIKSDPMWGLVNKHRSQRSNGWLDYIGYNRHKKVAPGTGDIQKVEAEAAALQKQINEMRSQK